MDWIYISILLLFYILIITAGILIKQRWIKLILGIILIGMSFWNDWSKMVFVGGLILIVFSFFKNKEEDYVEPETI